MGYTMTNNYRKY